MPPELHTLQQTGGSEPAGMIPPGDAQSLPHNPDAAEAQQRVFVVVGDLVLGTVAASRNRPKGLESANFYRAIAGLPSCQEMAQNPDELLRSLRLRILSCLDAEPLGDGVTHPAEKVVAEALARPDGHRAAFERLLETELSPEVLASLLRLTGRVGRAARREWRRNLVKGALGSPSPMLREAAVEAVEQWEDAELLPLLRAHTEPVAWLKSYIDDVIEDLGG